MYTFVNFDDLINEDNEIEAPEGLKDLLDELVENNYAEDLFGTWWETGDGDEEENWLKAKGIEVKTMKEILDDDPDAQFGFTYGSPDQRLDVTNASGYIEDMGAEREEYGVTAEDLGLDDEEDWDEDYDDYDDEEDYDEDEDE